MNNKKYTARDVIDFVVDGNQSEISDFSDSSDDEGGSQIVADGYESLDSNQSESDEDEVPLARLANNNILLAEPNVSTSSVKEDIQSTAPKHNYRWRKKDTLSSDYIFVGQFSDPPLEDKTPLQYFRQFITDDIIDLVVEQTNIYSCQKSGKSINVNREELMSLMGIRMKMGIVKLPSYKLYWSQELRYSPIADVMPRNRYQLLTSNLHFVNNDNVDATDKLAKIRPIIKAIRDECVKVEPEEHHSVDEQVIPSKTSFSSIRQYNPKKPKKWGFKNLVRAGASGYMYDFYVYDGKSSTDDVSEKFNHLQKSAQVVARLCQDLPGHQNFKVFFDNWFTTLDLLHYLKAEGILAVGTIRANRLQQCPIDTSKDLQKLGRGSMDYRCDANSGIIIVKWVDNSVVQLTSNFIGIEPMSEITRWCKKEKVRKQIPCPQIVKQYNKSMGGVDLADMLLALYRIPCKTKRWYKKVFWHLVDIAKVNAWILYCRHFKQYNYPQNKKKSLLIFSTDIAHALIFANKVAPNSSRGRPVKRKSIDLVSRGQKPAQPLPIPDVRYDNVAHWPIPSSNKNRCRLCGMTCRMTCSKCKIYLCLLENRNCFVEFHKQ